MTDLTISKFVWNKRLKFTAGVKNLFDVTSITGSASGEGAHAVSSGSVSIRMGRVYHLGIRLQLNSKLNYREMRLTILFISTILLTSCLKEERPGAKR